jgi:hypothetical protein
MSAESLSGRPTVPERSGAAGLLRNVVTTELSSANTRIYVSWHDMITDCKYIVLRQFPCA